MLSPGFWEYAVLVRLRSASRAIAVRSRSVRLAAEPWRDQVQADHSVSMVRARLVEMLVPQSLPSAMKREYPRRSMSSAQAAAMRWMSTQAWSARR